MGAVMDAVKLYGPPMGILAAVYFVLAGASVLASLVAGVVWGAAVVECYRWVAAARRAEPAAA